MALVLADRVKETTTTAGTGTITLSGASTGFQTFAVIGNSNTTFYCIAGQTTNEWEVGIGTYTSSGTTLARTTVLSNSSATQPSALSFSAGTKDVFVTYPASRSVYTTGTGSTANTVNGVMYANSTGVVTTGSALTFDGTNLTTTGSATATRFIPSGSTVATNGMYLPAANSLGFSTNSTERMRIDSVGNVGIGTTPSADTKIEVGGTYPTSATVTRVVRASGTIPSGTTGTARIFGSEVVTQAASFTVSSLQHFYASQGALGAGSALTNQYGFLAESNLTGATNNYGFYGNIASGTGRWNLYMAGTADNYLGGNLGIGANATNSSLVIAKTLTGATTGRFAWATAAVASDVTTNVFGFATNISTQAASFTLGDLVHVYANQSTIGAGSTVTNQYGFYANSTLTGATNNYGFYSNIASGSGRFNFYAAGTAANYFGGQIQLNQDYIEKPYSANSSTAITLDLTNGTVQIITLTGTATITMPTAVSGKSFIMYLKTGSGGYSVTWSTVKWPGGTAPTITSTASRMDIYSFFSDGTNWYGTTVGQNYTP